MAHTGEHDLYLVALSILIAMMGSYTALDLATRSNAARGFTKTTWLILAAGTMGASIWSMHFVGMLAFTLPHLPLSYDVPLTALSLAAPVTITAAGFLIAARGRNSLARLVGSGMIVGLGIVAMHYIGMHAMRGPFTLAFNPVWVGASVAIAIGAASTAIWLAFHSSGISWRVLAAIAMGFAVSGMHYVAMRGAEFAANVERSGAVETSLNQGQLAVWVAGISFGLLLTALIAASLDRRFREFAEAKAMSEEQFRLLVHAVNEYALFMLDRAGRVANWNSGAERIKGYASREIIGAPYEIFFNQADRDVSTPARALEAARKEGQYKGECWHVRKDGTSFLANLVIDPVFETSGQLVGYAVVVQDVTERRNKQTELETAQAALAQAQKMEAIGQLTGGVAHDFNNLLMAIIGSLDLVKKRVTTDVKALRLLENALQAAERGAGLTQRMLAFARKQELKPGPVAVDELIGGLQDLLQHMLGATCHIEARVPPNIPLVTADPNQLEVAVLNLCVNARDAMPTGGTIHVSARETSTFEAEALGLEGLRFVCIAVTDDGEGMDEETLRKAQEPFFTTKGVGKGTGLGLPMVQGMAEQSGGKLILKSTKGVGTVAEIWLPVSLTQVAAPNLHIAEPQPTTAALSVLVVDDDPVVLESTAAMLEDLGHRVIEARSGVEALHLLDRTRVVDLLVTDQVMPMMSGAELIAEVRERRPAMKTILASGYSDQANVDNVIRLNKPYDQQRLAKAISEALHAGEKNSVVVPFRPAPRV